MLDLDRVQQIVNRPHIVDLRDDGFTLMHPPACHPRLFKCEYNLAARDNLEDPGKRGQYLCALIRGRDGDPRFIVGDPAPDSEGVPWNALVTELRVARERDRIANSMRALLIDIVVNEVLVDENIAWARELLVAYDKLTEETPDAGAV